MNFNEAAWPDGVDDLEVISPSMIREQPEITWPNTSSPGVPGW